MRGRGWGVNRKRVQRLWREEGLRVPQRPGEVWALDFQFDRTADGRALKLLNVVDEYTREALAAVVERSVTADATVGRCWPSRNRPRCGAALPALRQRHGADGARAARLVPLLGDGDELHLSLIHI